MATRVIGLVEMQARIAAIRGSLPHTIDAALTAEAEAIMAVSKQLTPVDTGTLRASGFVDTPSVSGNVHHIEMGYGGAASEYAVIVHEVPPERAHHPVGQWKYLEQPLRDAAPNLLNNIANRIQFDT